MLEAPKVESKIKSRNLNKSGMSEESSNPKSHQDQKNSSIFVPNSPNRTASHESSVFRMRTRRSTIFYDELDEGDFSAPDYKIDDINLEIK